MTCGECGNVTAPGAGFPNHVYCKRFLLHMEKREDASRCRYFIQKPITNADRIRAMTDEELAEWLERIRLCCATDLCGRSCPFVEVCYSNADAPKETLDWLIEEGE